MRWSLHWNDVDVDGDLIGRIYCCSFANPSQAAEEEGVTAAAAAAAAVDSEAFGHLPS